jgi:pyruvate/2-oxoglutarate dehydrogenase complex dihydrolipoamide dehydrogenase (E3) component
VSETLRPDLCVIGGGETGLAAAIVAAALGVSVVLVEQNRLGGKGDALARAVLVAASRRLDEVRRSETVAVPYEREVVADWGRIGHRVRKLRQARLATATAQRYRAMGVNIIEGSASFLDRRTVEVAGQHIAARAFLIATGTLTHTPDLAGGDQVPILVPADVAALPEMPDHLVVVGGDAASVEIAQAVRRLGGRVSLVLDKPDLPGHDDEEMAAVVLRSVAADGVDICIGRVEHVGPRQPSGVILTVESDTRRLIHASHLLMGGLSIADVQALDISKAGIGLSNGRIAVDRNLRTANPRIYAAGSCAEWGPLGIRAGALQAAAVARHALLRLPARLDPSQVPRVVQSDPPLASVGLNEGEARRAAPAIRILRASVADTRAGLVSGSRGHIKAIVTARGRVLGCQIAAPRADELIHPWTIAIAHGLKVTDLAALPVWEAGFPELTRLAAVEFVKPTLRSPWLQRAIGLNRLLG